MRGDLQRIQRVLLLVAVGVACAPLPAKSPDEGAAAQGDAAASATPAAAPAAPPSAEELAAQAAAGNAKAWLTLVDQEQYPASWDAAAPLFQSSTSREQWEKAARGARAPLGGLSKRELRASEYKTSLPNAPAGEYVVVHYDSAFVNKAQAREIVTLMRTPDQAWKVVGYFVE